MSGQEGEQVFGTFAFVTVQVLAGSELEHGRAAQEVHAAPYLPWSSGLTKWDEGTEHPTDT